MCGWAWVRDRKRERWCRGGGNGEGDLLKILFNYVSVGVCAHKCSGHGVRGVRVPGAGVREAVVVWMLGTELGPSGEAACPVNC